MGKLCFSPLKATSPARSPPIGPGGLLERAARNYASRGVNNKTPCVSMHAPTVCGAAARWLPILRLKAYAQKLGEGERERGEERGRKSVLRPREVAAHRFWKLARCLPRAVSLTCLINSGMRESKRFLENFDLGLQV